MKRIDIWFFAAILVIMTVVFSACDQITPVEIFNQENIVLNESVEYGSDTPLEWFFSEGDSAAMQQGLWMDGDGFDGTRSLKVSLNQEEIEYIYWGQLRVGRPLANKPLILKAMVKAVDIQGQGAALIFRGDHSEKPKGAGEFLANSQEITKIEGSHDWMEYQVVLEEGMDRDTESILISVGLLPETTGTVFFDLISLGYQE